MEVRPSVVQRVVVVIGVLCLGRRAAAPASGVALLVAALLPRPARR
jgi:hypothetical protein